MLVDASKMILRQRRAGTSWLRQAPRLRIEVRPLPFGAPVFEPLFSCAETYRHVTLMFAVASSANLFAVASSGDNLHVMVWGEI